MAIVTGLPAYKGLAAAQNGIRIRPGYYTAAPTTELVKGDNSNMDDSDKPFLQRLKIPSFGDFVDYKRMVQMGMDVY